MNSTKRTYHPLIILLYSYNMLDKTQIKSIPRSTRFYWKEFKNENYFGHQWTVDYINQFEDIKSIYTQKYLFRTVRCLVKMSDCYHSILMDSKNYKKKMRQKSNSIINQVDNFIKYGLNIKSACRILGINHNWYYRQKLKLQCKISPKGNCYRQQPNQLTTNEVNRIQEIISDQKNFGKTLTTLYYLAMNNAKLFCSKSTFMNYAHALGYKRRKVKKSLPKEGFKASRSFEWLHVDITNVQTMVSGIQKVAFVKDNFSGALLHKKSTSGKAGSEFIRDLFQETFDKYGLFNAVNPINILSDGGPENKGAFLDWIEQINTPPQVKKVTASTDEFPYSNSMSESTHSTYKTEFMKGKHSYNEDIHLNNLDRFMNYYNEERYPGRFYGLTVLEVLGGEIPDKQRFKEQIATAKKKRVEENRAFNGCPTFNNIDSDCHNQLS